MYSYNGSRIWNKVCICRQYSLEMLRQGGEGNTVSFTMNFVCNHTMFADGHPCGNASPEFLHTIMCKQKLGENILCKYRLVVGYIWSWKQLWRLAAYRMRAGSDHSIGRGVGGQGRSLSPRDGEVHVGRHPVKAFRIAALSVDCLFIKKTVTSATRHGLKLGAVDSLARRRGGRHKKSPASKLLIISGPKSH